MISIDHRPLACPPVRRSFLPVDLEPRVRGGGVVLDVAGHMPKIRNGAVLDVEGHMPRVGRGLVLASPRLPNRVDRTPVVAG